MSKTKFIIEVDVENEKGNFSLSVGEINQMIQSGFEAEFSGEKYDVVAIRKEKIKDKVGEKK